MRARVCVAGHGHSALALFKRQPFDIVFLYIHMPVLRGQQFTEAMRTWERNQQLEDTPNIAVTAHALPHQTHLFLQAGLNDCLSKPISEQSLAQAIAKWTGIFIGNQSTFTLSQEQITQHQQLPIIDLQEGRALSNGKESLAKELLHLLAESLPSDRLYMQ